MLTCGYDALLLQYLICSQPWCWFFPILHEAGTHLLFSSSCYILFFNAVSIFWPISCGMSSRIRTSGPELRYLILKLGCADRYFISWWIAAHWAEPADAQKRANCDTANEILNRVHVAANCSIARTSDDASAWADQGALGRLQPWECYTRRYLHLLRSQRVPTTSWCNQNTQ